MCATARNAVVFAGLLALIAARSALGVPVLEAGDLLTTTGLSVRVLDGPLRSEAIVSGRLRLSADFSYSAGGFRHASCSTGALVADGDAVFTVEWQLQRFARIDLVTGAWQLVPPAENVGAPDFYALYDDRSPFEPRLAFEPSGALLIAHGEWGDRRLIRLDPATGDAFVFANMTNPPDEVGVAGDATIVVLDAASSPGSGSNLLDTDPVTAVSTLWIESAPLGLPSAMALVPNGDALIGTEIEASSHAVLRVDAAGTLSTLSGDAIGAGPALGPIDALAILPGGDVVVLGSPPDDAILVRVDGATGDRSVFSGAGTGVGPELASVAAIAPAADGAVLAIDCVSNRILRIDAATGDREVVVDPQVGAGPPPKADAAAAAIDRQRRIVWGEAFPRDTDRILSIDATSGDRSVFSSAVVGTGDALTTPISLAFAPDGDLLATLVSPYFDPKGGLGYCRPKIFRIDADTGDRSVASGSVGAGPLLRCPRNLAMGADSYLYVVDYNGDPFAPDWKLLRVDLANGNRTIVGDDTHGTGPLWQWIWGLAADASGSLFVVDSDGLNGRILRIDANTGNRSVLSGNGVGAGDAFAPLSSIAVDLDSSILVHESDDKVLRVDAVTGDRSLLLQEPEVHHLLVVPALAPEPGAAEIGLIAFASLAARARRSQTR